MEASDTQVSSLDNDGTVNTSKSVYGISLFLFAYLIRFGEIFIREKKCVWNSGKQKCKWTFSHEKFTENPVVFSNGKMCETVFGVADANWMCRCRELSGYFRIQQ